MSPLLSVVVISYNMNRELPRTLFSMSVPYQRDIARDDYEVIVVDNGSKVPPRLEDFAGLDVNLKVFSMQNPTHSPVPAINFGVAQSSGRQVCVYIDGARIASPRLFASAREELSLHPRAVVGSRGRYLGPKLQRDSMLDGYNQEVEDRLLADSGWQENGYRLFDHSVLDESSGPSWVSPVAESNSLFMRREFFDELGGFDEKFTTPGGGLVNLDTWRRACEAPDSRPVLLLGEATFHQVHGGVATNGSMRRIEGFFVEYLELRGYEFEKPDVPMRYAGTFVVQPPLHELVEKEHLLPPTAPRSTRLMTILKRVADRLGPRGRRRAQEASRFIRSLAKGRLGGYFDERRAAGEIRSSQFFDAAWYLDAYPEVGASGYDPALHFLRYGLVERRQPGPRFDSVWYGDRYHDVSRSGANALLHYIRHGESEGRRFKAIEPQESH